MLPVISLFVSLSISLPLHDTIPGKSISQQLTNYTYPDSIDPRSMQMAEVNLQDSTIEVYQNIRKDYRIIGYEKPNNGSKRLIIFSVFTRDVDGNPYKCPYGAYYSTSADAYELLQMKYTGKVGKYAKADLFVEGKKRAVLYFEQRWLRFTKG